MTSKYRNLLALACLLLVGAFLFVGCGTNTSTNSNDTTLCLPSDQTESAQEAVTKVTLDAFEGLKVSFEGISPRCGVVLDNSECSEQIRSSVTYKTDKQFYANQEIVTVTATLSQQAKNSFTLKSETMTYEVTNMPAYYSADSMAATDIIEDELKDFVNAEIAQMTQTNKLFGVGGYSPDWHYTKVESVTSSKGYLLTVKDTKAEQYGSQNAPFYNSIRIVADCHAHNDGTAGPLEGHIYICFILNDVIVSPDGKISWKNNTYDISYTAKVNDNTVANDTVHSLAVYYEIQELAKTDWISIINH